MDKLKEYIKQLVRELIDEESTSGAAGAYSTPFAFAKKGQKTNAATKTAQSQGYKKAPGMPKNSKVFDYKELWKGKKSAMNEDTNGLKLGDKVKYNNQEWEIIGFLVNNTIRLKSLKGLPSVNVMPEKVELIAESDYDKASVSSQASGYAAASGYTAGGIKGDDYYKKESMNTIQDIIKEELLKEGTYKQFKSEVKYRTKAEQLHKAMREVKRKLSEIDRIVEYTQRMKQELSEGDGVQYWGRTEKAVAQISEMVNHLNNKINNLKQ